MSAAGSLHRAVYMRRRGCAAGERRGAILHNRARGLLAQQMCPRLDRLVDACMPACEPQRGRRRCLPVRAHRRPQHDGHTAAQNKCAQPQPTAQHDDALLFLSTSHNPSCVRAFQGAARPAACPTAPCWWPRCVHSRMLPIDALVLTHARPAAASCCCCKSETRRAHSVYVRCMFCRC